MGYETSDGVPTGASGRGYPSFALAVQTISDLRAIDTARREDKQIRLIEDKKSSYRFDLQATGADDGESIIVPNDIMPPDPGRWLKIQTAGEIGSMSRYPTPQDAIQAAIDSGVNAVFVDAMFTITAPLTISAARFALIGLGMNTGFDLNSGAASGALSISASEVLVKDLSIHVSNCAATAEVISIAGARCRIEGVRITFDAAVTAVVGSHLTGGTHHTLSHVTIDCTGGATVADGVVIDTGRTDCLLEAVTVLGASQNGIEIAADRIRLETPYINGCGQYNIFLTTATDCDIVGGMNIDAGDIGVFWSYPAVEIRRGTIVGHTITNPTNYGISTGNEADLWLFLGIHGCLISDAGLDAIKSARARITGCSLYNFGRSGIRTGSSIEAAGNKLYSVINTGPGIHISAGASAHQICGNFILAIGASIQLESLADSIIDGNLCWSMAGGGIRIVTRGQAGIISNNKVIAGRISINETGAASGDIEILGNLVAGSGGNGIELLGNLSDCIIANNRVDNPTTTGIFLAAGINDCIVEGNRIDSATDGINLADCDRCSITSNSIRTCSDNGIELAALSTRNLINSNVTSGCTTDGIFLADTCDYNLVGLNQIPDGLTMGAGANNEHYFNMI